MQEIILKVRYFERGLSKSLKKGNFISHLLLFNRQNYQKQNVTKQIQKNSFISYVLSDQV